MLKGLVIIFFRRRCSRLNVTNLREHLILEEMLN